MIGTGLIWTFGLLEPMTGSGKYGGFEQYGFVLFHGMKSHKKR